ncbi:MAG: glycosyltransferase family 9 protein [Verrucomicrobiota bacterium]
MGFKRLRLHLKRLLYAHLRGVERTPPTRFRKLCIYKRDGIGDFILAISAIRLLVQEFGAENTVLIIWPQVAELAAAEFPGVERIVLALAAPARLINRLTVLRKQRSALAQYSFDRLISLRHQRGDDDDLALSWIRAKRSFGIICKGAFERPPETSIEHYRLSDPVVHTMSSVPDTTDGLCEELRNHQALLSSVLGRPVMAAEILPTVSSFPPASENYAVVSALPGVPPIPGAPSTSLRNIPFGLLEAGIRRMQFRGIDRVYLCGSSQQEKALAELALKLATVDLKVEVSTPGNFHEFGCLLARSRCVLASETGAAHLAVALDKPSVILIGGGHYGFFAPWTHSSKQIWLTNRVPCFYCNWVCSQAEPFCLTKISSDGIRTALDEILGSAGNPEIAANEKTVGK